MKKTVKKKKFTIRKKKKKFFNYFKTRISFF